MNLSGIVPVSVDHLPNDSEGFDMMFSSRKVVLDPMKAVMRIQMRLMREASMSPHRAAEVHQLIREKYNREYRVVTNLINDIHDLVKSIAIKRE